MKRKALLVEYNDACAETKAIYDEAMRTLGISFVPNWMKALGRNPVILRANWFKFKYTVLEGNIPALLKQLILYVISVRANNQYCISAHGHAALSIDPSLTCEDLFSMSTGNSYKGLPRSFRVAIEMISRLALEPEAVEETSFDYDTQLADAGFTDAEIDELVSQADFGVMMNTIMNALEVPADLPFPPKPGAVSERHC